MQCKDRGAMLSSKGAKTVRLQKKKSGLDFSVKGGKEHGIPIVVSWIKEGGVACEKHTHSAWGWGSTLCLCLPQPLSFV